MERLIGQRDDAIGFRALLGPDDGAAAAGQRQDGKRPGREEMLLGASLMIALVRDRCDDSRLVVGPAEALDTGAFAQPRARTIRRYHEAGRDGAAVAQLSGAAITVRFATRHRSGAQVDTERACLVDQEGDEIAVLDHVRERLAGCNLAVECE